jgi:hypothetical protein
MKIKLLAPGYIVMRNGVPCMLMSLTVPHLPRIRNICVPSEIPPVPHIFKQHAWSQAARERTRKVSSRLRGSIHADFIRKKFPRLESLFTEGKYTIHENSNYQESKK